MLNELDNVFNLNHLTAKNGFAKIQIGGWKMKRLKFNLQNKNKIIRDFKLVKCGTLKIED